MPFGLQICPQGFPFLCLVTNRDFKIFVSVVCWYTQKQTWFSTLFFLAVLLGLSLSSSIVYQCSPHFQINNCTLRSTFSLSICLPFGSFSYLEHWLEPLEKQLVELELKDCPVAMWVHQLILGEVLSFKETRRYRILSSHNVKNVETRKLHNPWHVG